jgi:hypothetical protein
MLTPQAGVQVDKFYAPVDWQYSFPEGYTRLEYLESTGTQYINTRIVTNSDLVIDIEFYLVAGSGIFGKSITINGINKTYGWDARNATGYLRIGSGYMTGNTEWALDKWLYLHMENDRDKTTLNGVKFTNNYNYGNANFSDGSDITLFRYQGADAGYLKGRIKYFRIKQENTLVRNFVPVKRNSDNKPGMYDLVNNVFYVNQGTGEFVMGSELYSNNSQIDIRQKNNTNFVEKYKFNANNELIWANPQLNLSGPVNYSVVGSPTIIDGVVSGFLYTKYLTVPKLDFTKDIDYVVKYNYSLSETNYRNVFLGKSGSTIFQFNGGTNGKDLTFILNNTTKYWYNCNFKDYTYLRFQKNGSNLILSLGNTKDIWDSSYTISNISWSNVDIVNEIGRTQSTNTTSTCSIDLKETYIKVNDKLWFYGKNYTSENYAPVPAGLNYNNTTTPSIGYVNTQTQEFIPAPTDGIKYSQTRDIKVIPPEDNTITLLYGTDPIHHLPNEYEELAGITFTGTQYIDTGFKANQDTRVVTEFATINITVTQGIFSSRNSSFDKAFSCFVYEAKIQADYDSTRKVIITPVNNTYYKIDFNKNEFYVNNVLRETFTYANFQSNYNMLLGASSSSGSSISNYLKGTLKATQIYDNGTLIRNLIPARRKNDGVLGMLDLANKDQNDEYIFYTNQGTGTFTAVELKYKLFGLLANTSSGNYDVYIDDVLYATTTKNTQTDIDFSTLGNEYVPIGTCTTPEELVLHKIVVKPTTNGQTITQFKCRRTSGVSTQQNHGALWMHYELSNQINLSSLLNNGSDYYNYIIHAITAKNDIILTTNVSASFRGSKNNFKYLPLIKSNGSIDIYNMGGQSALGRFKRLRFQTEQNLTGNTDFSLVSLDNLEQLVFNKALRVQSNTTTAWYKLKLPPKIYKPTSTNPAITEASSLYPTKLDFSDTTGMTICKVNGSSSYTSRGLRGLKVSNEAPFTGTSPQINVSYTGLDRDALVELFESMPGYMKLTKVGEPTIDSNGVVSGFSVNDYLKINVNLATADSWEICLKTGGENYGYILGSNIERIIAYSITASTIYLSSDGANWDIASSVGTGNRTPANCYLRIKFTGSQYITEYSTDLINWINIATIDSATKIANMQYLVLGRWWTSDAQRYRGSIDLKNSYIKINNARYQFQLPDDTTTRAINITAATGNNLTKVGTGVTIDENGVASGGSNSNYLSIPNRFSANKIEVNIKFKIGAYAWGELFWGTNTQTDWCLEITSIGLLRFYFNLGLGPSSYFHSPKLSLDHYYQIIEKVTKDTLYVKLIDYSNNSVIFTSTKERTIKAEPYLNNMSFLRGTNSSLISIDLENTYIKVGNNYLMRGYLTDNDKAILTKKNWTLA